MPSRPGSRRRPPLSRDAVLREALKLVDSEGVSGLSMRRLADRLGIEAMTLYYYVDGKDAILDGVFDLVVSEIEIPDRALPWQARLHTLLSSFRSALTRHPHTVPIILTRRADNPGVWVSARAQATASGEAVTQAYFDALHDAGLAPAEAQRWYRIVAGFSIGFTINEIQWEPQVKGLASSPSASGAFSAAAGPIRSDEDAGFELGLSVLVGAIQDAVAASAAPRRGSAAS